MSPFLLIDTRHLRDSMRPAAKAAVQRAGNSAPSISPRVPGEPGEPVSELRLLSVLMGTTLAIGIVSFVAVEAFRLSVRLKPPRSRVKP